MVVWHAAGLGFSVTWLSAVFLTQLIPYITAHCSLLQPASPHRAHKEFSATDRLTQLEKECFAQVWCLRLNISEKCSKVGCTDWPLSQSLSHSPWMWQITFMPFWESVRRKKKREKKIATIQDKTIQMMLKFLTWWVDFISKKSFLFASILTFLHLCPILLCRDYAVKKTSWYLGWQSLGWILADSAWAYLPFFLPRNHISYGCLKKSAVQNSVSI